MQYTVSKIYVRPNSQIIGITYLCNLGFTCYINVDFKVELIMLNFLLQIFQVIHMYNDFVIQFYFCI